jgi:hypothetical protein
MRLSRIPLRDCESEDSIFWGPDKLGEHSFLWLCTELSISLALHLLERKGASGRYLLLVALARLLQGSVEKGELG